MCFLACEWVCVKPMLVEYGYCEARLWPVCLDTQHALGVKGGQPLLYRIFWFGELGAVSWGLDVKDKASQAGETALRQHNIHTFKIEGAHVAPANRQNDLLQPW